MADTTLIESATWTPGTVVPVPGDAVRAGATNPGSVRKLGQEVANRTSYLRPAAEQTVGTSLLPFTRIYTDLTSVVVIGLGTVAFWADGAQTTTIYGTHTGSSLTLTGLSAGSFFYLYLYYSTGAAVLEASTTGPDTQGIFKTGDATRRYIGIAVTYDSDGAGTPQFVPSQQERGHWIAGCDTSTIGGRANPLALLSGVVGTGSWQTLTPPVPARALAVDVFAQVVRASGAAAGVLQVRRSGETASSRTVCTAAEQGPVLALVKRINATGTPPSHETVTGAKVGDKVALVIAPTTGADVSSSFESTISVADQLQQTSGPLTNPQIAFIERDLAHDTSGCIPVELDSTAHSFDYLADASLTIRRMVIAGFYL